MNHSPDTAWIETIVATAQAPGWCAARPGLGFLVSSGSRLATHVLIAHAAALSHAPPGTCVDELDGHGRSELAPRCWSRYCDHPTVTRLAVAADRIVLRVHDTGPPLALTAGDDLLVRWMLIIASRAADCAGKDDWYAEADARAAGIEWDGMEPEQRRQLGRLQWLHDTTEALLDGRQPQIVDLITEDPGSDHPYHPTRWFDPWPLVGPTKVASHEPRNPLASIQPPTKDDAADRKGRA